MAVYRPVPGLNPISFSGVMGSWYGAGANQDCTVTPVSGPMYEAEVLLNLGDYFAPPISDEFLGKPLQ